MFSQLCGAAQAFLEKARDNLNMLERQGMVSQMSAAEFAGEFNLDVK